MKGFHDCAFPIRIWRHIRTCAHIPVPVIAMTTTPAIGVARTAARIGTKKTSEILSLTVEQVEAAIDWNTRRNQ